ncbi:unnamed protein product, partial [marine sediment metagenome]
SLAVFFSWRRKLIKAVTATTAAIVRIRNKN